MERLPEMNTSVSRATFAFSDEELLDVLTNIADDADGLAPTDRHARPQIETLFSLVDAAGFAPQLQSCHADADDAASTDSSSEMATLADRESTTGDSQTSPDAKPKPSRKRRKHELDAIRALASSLESQLASLKQRHHPEQPGANLFWKRVADQLLLDRQRATSENARLRDIFQDQAKVLKSIQKAIQKSPDLEKLGVAPSPSPPLDETSSNDVYNQLFKDVAESYPGTDQILEKAGVREATETKRRVNMNMHTEDGRSVMTMEVAESRTVPFHVSTVSESVWEFLSRTTCAKDDDELFKRSFKSRGNDVFGVCKIGCSLGLYTLNADVAVRRFTDGNRLTFVWECVGRCDNEPNPFSSFRLQEKGWVVFEPSPVDPMNKSVYRTCVHFVPQPLDPSHELGTGAKDVGLATEVALSVYERTIGYIYESILSELMGGVSLEGGS